MIQLGRDFYSPSPRLALRAPHTATEYAARIGISFRRFFIEFTFLARSHRTRRIACRQLLYYLPDSSPLPLPLAFIDADFTIGFDVVPIFGEPSDDGPAAFVLIVGTGVEDPFGFVAIRWSSAFNASARRRSASALAPPAPPIPL